VAHFVYSRFGETRKIVVTKRSAYVTFSKAQSALRAVHHINNLGGFRFVQYIMYISSYLANECKSN